MTLKMFVMLDKTKPDIENIRGLNLAAVKHKTVQVTRLLLWRKCKIVNIFNIMTSDLLLQTMTLTKTDPSSRQRGRPTKKRP
jgi:hypothetical protein